MANLRAFGKGFRLELDEKSKCMMMKTAVLNDHLYNCDAGESIFAL